MKVAPSKQSDPSTLNLFPKKHSNVTVLDHGRIYTKTGEEISDSVRAFIDEQKPYILNRNFSCPGAKATRGKEGTVYIGSYGGDIIDNTDVLYGLLHDVQQFAIEQDIAHTLEQKQMPKKVFNGIFPEVEFENNLEAQIFFAKLLKLLNDEDAKFYPAATGYSRRPTDANYMICIGGIPYFANVGYKFQDKYDRYAAIPNILLAPQDSFNWLKERNDKNGVNEYAKMTKEVRDTLTMVHGAYHPGLSSLKNGTPAIGNFLLTDDDERTIRAVSDIMEFTPERYKENLAAALIESTKCPYHKVKNTVIKEIRKIFHAIKK